ncbi:hypothetical protein HDU97_007062 [Phlyctochytrium planicorne]|nr:hypothetical protein HDU97_007062 [Phlyctochytrium planicorne]
MSIIGVRDVKFNISDMNASIRFYRDLLGLCLVEMHDGHSIVQAGNTRIDLTEKQSPIPSISHDGGVAESGGTLSFQVVGIQELVKKLRDNEVSFITDIENNNRGKVAAFQDPDGNILRLYEVKN